MDAKGRTAHVVSHTHWDREWALTQRQIQLMLAQTTDEILDLLEARPDFTAFVADGQTMLFHDYTELRPQNRERFLKLARGGRLELGPWLTMPDLWLPTGESLIRNLLAGLLDCEALGLPHPKMGYVPDSFGHIEQMPQLMNGFRIETYLFGRGDTMAGLCDTMQFRWGDPSGRSSVLAHRLVPDGYGAAVGLAAPHEADKLRGQIGRLLDHIAQHSADPSVALLMNGIDHIWVQADLPEVLSALRTLFPDWEFKQTVLSEYLRAFQEPDSLPQASGCLRGSHLSEGQLHGTWSSRIDTKLANARAEGALLNQAEPLAAIAGAFGGPDRRRETNMAWRLLLANHAHDSICGCSADAVHADNLRRFGQAVEIAEMVAAEALEALNAEAMREDVHTLVHYAGLGGSRGPVEFMVDRLDGAADAGGCCSAGSAADADGCCSAGSAADAGGCCSAVDAARASLHLVGADGATYPVQVLGSRKLSRGDVTFDGVAFRLDETTRFTFTETKCVALLPPAPPASVARFRVAEGPAPIPADADSVAGRVELAGASADTCVVLENKHLRVHALTDGTLTVLHKATGTEYGGLLALKHQADLGGGYTFRPLAGDPGRMSSGPGTFQLELLEAGPFRAAVAISGVWRLPADGTATGRAALEVAALEGSIGVRTVVRLSSGDSTLTCRTVLDNHCKSHRVRLQVPLPYPSGVAEVERSFVVASEAMAAYSADPGQASHPMRNWVSVASPSGGAGVAFVGKGLHEFALTPGGGGACLEVTLLRCVPFVHDCGTWATPAAQMQGETALEYALVFHSGDWRSEGVDATAHRFAYAGVAQPHGGPRPSWDATMHASVSLTCDGLAGPAAFTDMHRSTWRTVHGERDGWRRWERRRLPKLVTPPDLRPVEIDGEHVLLSAMKLAERGLDGGADSTRDIIVRMYSLAESAQTVVVRLGFPVECVWRANLDESPIGDPLPRGADGSLQMHLAPYEIATLRVRP